MTFENFPVLFLVFVLLWVGSISLSDAFCQNLIRNERKWPATCMVIPQANKLRKSFAVKSARSNSSASEDDRKTVRRKRSSNSSVDGDDQSDDDDEIDIDLVQETVMDQSIAKAVKQMLDMGEKEPQPNPVEVFNDLYKGIKQKDGAEQMSSEEMLKKLFPDDPNKEVFDERKVMMKLMKIMEQEDFNGVFKDPTVGDWL